MSVWRRILIFAFAFACGSDFERLWHGEGDAFFDSQILLATVMLISGVCAFYFLMLRA